MSYFEDAIVKIRAAAHALKSRSFYSARGFLNDAKGNAKIYYPKLLSLIEYMLDMCDSNEVNDEFIQSVLDNVE